MRLRLPTACLLALYALAAPALGQPAGEEEAVLKPTWETQRHARTYTLTIPAPRGQISDRNGLPLAQTRVSYNLALRFPTPTTLSDAAALAWARERIARAEKLVGKPTVVKEEAILKHYHNRGILPLDLYTDLSVPEQLRVREAGDAEGADGLGFREIYLRYYPHGAAAAHLIGYATREGRTPDGPLQNGDLLWPETLGREGLEKTFNEQLAGRPGKLTITFNAKGERVSERVTEPPTPGYNIVTTLDLPLQQICEKVLAESVRRGAVVFTDPNSGDILAMASYPTFDPNAFIPVISPEAYRALDENPDKPLIPRGFRAAYPPGSTFKAFSALAALESGRITPTSEFSGPPSYQIGNLTFRNWKKTHAGMLNVVGALEQSNNTWFYQVGIRTGSRSLVDWTSRFGFGTPTGIPLAAETAGRLPDDDYMRKVHNRRLLEGDLANFAIGQGDILTSPLQLAQAFGTLANGGNFFKARLVSQVQSLDDQIVTGYEVRLRDQLPLHPELVDAVRKGLVKATSGGQGTGHRASLNRVQVAGKTGTAEWGPKQNKRYAAWFAGFVPAQEARYAFAAVYESERNESRAHGGTVAAPIIGKILKEVYKDEEKKSSGKKKKPKPTPPPEEDESD